MRRNPFVRKSFLIHSTNHRFSPTKHTRDVEKDAEENVDSAPDAADPAAAAIAAAADATATGVA